MHDGLQSRIVNIVIEHGARAMPDTPSAKPPRPPARGRRWTSFIAPEDAGGQAVRRLQEEANPKHRVRVEYDAFTR